MFDAMFGNMSPVFPFDTTPTSGNNVDDPFGLNMSGTGNGGHVRNDSFSGWTDFAGTTDSGINTFASGQNGFGAVSGPVLGGQANTGNNNLQPQPQPQPQMQANNANPNSAFDLNAAWTAWTNGGNNGSFAAATANAQNQSQNQQYINNMEGTPVNQASSSTGVSPLSNLNVPQLHHSRSSSAPAGAVHTNQSNIPSQPMQNTRAQPQPPQTQAQAQNPPGQVGPSIEISQPIGNANTNTFAHIHQGNNGFRSNRTTPSEVYRTVVKP